MKDKINIDLFPSKEVLSISETAANILVNAILNNDYNDFNAEPIDGVTHIKSQVLFDKNPKLDEAVIIAQIFNEHNIDAKILKDPKHNEMLQDGQSKIEKNPQFSANKDEFSSESFLLEDIAPHNKDGIAPYLNALDINKNKALISEYLELNIIDSVSLFKKAAAQDLALANDFILDNQKKTIDQKLQMLEMATEAFDKRFSEAVLLTLTDGEYSVIKAQNELTEQYNNLVKKIIKDVDLSKIPNGKESVILNLPDKYVQKYLKTKPDLKIEFEHKVFGKVSIEN